jgi:hypothetical protein
MGDAYDLVNTTKTKFSASRVVLSGVLRRKDVSWRRIGAVNDRLEWVANTLGVTFRDDYITFRRDRGTRGGGVFICVKNYMDCRELWTDKDFEMIAVEVKGRDPKFTWEIIGTYRAPNEDMRLGERLVARTA